MHALARLRERVGARASERLATDEQPICHLERSERSCIVLTQEQRFLAFGSK
jgi:hypothetical protein